MTIKEAQRRLGRAEAAYHVAKPKSEGARAFLAKVYRARSLEVLRAKGLR